MPVVRSKSGGASFPPALISHLGIEGAEYCKTHLFLTAAQSSFIKAHRQTQLVFLKTPFSYTCEILSAICRIQDKVIARKAALIAIREPNVFRVTVPRKVTKDKFHVTFVIPPPPNMFKLRLKITLFLHSHNPHGMVKRSKLECFIRNIFNICSLLCVLD